MILAFFSLAIWTNTSGGTSLPRSYTVYPEPRRKAHTTCFPISWMSPCTVPMTTTPLVGTPPPDRSGSNTFIPSSMAWEAASTWGRNILPSLNRLLMLTIPRPSPLSIAWKGSMFSLNERAAASRARSLFQVSTASLNCVSTSLFSLTLPPLPYLLKRVGNDAL